MASAKVEEEVQQRRGRNAPPSMSDPREGKDGEEIWDLDCERELTGRR